LTTLRSDQLRLILVARGSSLRELLTRSELTASASGVLISMEEVEVGRTLQARLEQVELTAVEGQPAHLHVLGALNEKPFQLDLEIASPEERTLGGSVPVRVTLESGPGSLTLETQLRLPVDLRQFEHRFVLEGEDLFEFLEQDGDRLFRTGPFRLEAVIKGRPGAYSLEGVRLNTGESVIDGAGSLNTQAEAPVMQLRISSERLVLEDFLDPVLRTQLEEALEQRQPDESTTVEIPSDSTWDLTRMREKLRTFGASVSIDLEGLVFGGKLLGSGALSIELDAGVLGVTADFSPATGGAAVFGLQLDTDGNRIAGSLLAEIASLDLGSVIERFELEDLDAGRLALDLEASFDGATREEALASTNGHLDVTYYPEGADTRLLDLWAGPLIKGILPSTGSDPSRMNCILAWFEIDQGRLTPDAFYLDTSRMRARGSGTIHLPTGELDLKLSPRPKSRTFINLATPVRVQGTWDDPTIRFTRGGLAGTMLKFYLWTITIWRDLTRRPLPQDGSDICMDPPPRRAAEERLSPPR